MHADGRGGGGAYFTKGYERGVLCTVLLLLLSMHGLINYKDIKY
jgi:hypothetical protein